MIDSRIDPDPEPPECCMRCGRHEGFDFRLLDICGYVWCGDCLEEFKRRDEMAKQHNQAMKPADIQAGHTYRNRFAGRTTRTVLAIGDEHRPDAWNGGYGSKPPDEPGVLYEQDGKQRKLYISSFAKWAGFDVTAK